MKALDTNVLIRFLVNDDRKQSGFVRQLLSDAEKSDGTYLVTLPVVLEVIWVLRSVYELENAHILNAIDQLSLMPVLIFDRADCVQELVRQGTKSGLELDDLLIGVCGRLTGAGTTLTFDQKAAQEPWFELLGSNTAC